MVLALPSSEGPTFAVEGRDGLCRAGDEAQSWRPVIIFGSSTRVHSGWRVSLGFCTSFADRWGFQRWGFRYFFFSLLGIGMIAYLSYIPYFSFSSFPDDR